MGIETKIEEIKEVVMKRVPPGDRWSPVGSPSVTLMHWNITSRTQDKPNFSCLLEKGQ
jgi:hypothetical protein